MAFHDREANLHGGNGHSNFFECLFRSISVRPSAVERASVSFHVSRQDVSWCRVTALLVLNNFVQWLHLGIVLNQESKRTVGGGEGWMYSQ